MGKSGWYIPTVELAHAATADENVIHNAIFDWLFRQWRECLHHNTSLLYYSEGWFDSLLTLEIEKNGPNVGLTFWFNESVDWPLSNC
jgi:hypothetical protein